MARTTRRQPSATPCSVRRVHNVLLMLALAGGTNSDPDSESGGGIPNASPGELVILSLSPSSGLTSAGYAVTIRGNNFQGVETWYAKFGTAYSPLVEKVGPTTLRAFPPAGQSPGQVHVYVSPNDQNWVDACQTKQGETTDHIINVGPCNTFEFTSDPICYTCQSPNNPVALSGTSITPNYIFAVILVLMAFALQQNPDALDLRVFGH
jgi:hypothetical protein